MDHGTHPFEPQHAAPPSLRWLRSLGSPRVVHKLGPILFAPQTRNTWDTEPDSLESLLMATFFPLQSRGEIFIFMRLMDFSTKVPGT